MSENPSKKTLKNAEVFHVKKKAFLEVEQLLSCDCVNLCGKFNFNCLLFHKQCICNIRCGKCVSILSHFTNLQQVRVNKAT